MRRGGGVGTAMGMTSSLSFMGSTGVCVYDPCLVLSGLGGRN